MLKKEIQRLENILQSAPRLILNIDSDSFSKKPAENKWSKKEILGHLCDSAFNNIQRFIRIQYEDDLHIVYDQDKWVDSSNYNTKSMEDVLALWQNLNAHIINIWEKIDPDKLQRTCDTGREKSNPVTLEFLIKDYNEHLAYHMNQIVPK